MTRRTKILIGIVVVLFLCAISYLLFYFIALQSQPRATQPRTSTRVEVTLRCDECEDAGMEINLWRSPTDRRLVGSVPNRTRAIVLEQSTDSTGFTHYKVSAGSVTGWVSEYMVQR